MDVEFLSQNWHLILAFVFLLGLIFLEPVILKTAGINMIGPLRVTQLVNRESATIVDVCSTKEYTESHIPDAINMPLSEFKNASDDMAKYSDKPVVVSCRSGSRSKSAAKKLVKFGFKDVYILTGGNMAWEKENLPMTRNG